MKLEVIIFSSEIRQNSPIAISDFNIFPEEKPPDPGASTLLTGRSRMLPGKTGGSKKENQIVF